MIDAFASEPHYRAHIAPVFNALPANVRGEWKREGDGPVIVSSYNDLRACRDRPVIFMEHGAGQTYGDGLSSYAGGPNRDPVRLFLCPGEAVAERNRMAYPSVPAVAVGCPKLDRWIGAKRPGVGVVGLAFHWDARVVPETRTALPHYAASLESLGELQSVLATAHPRIWDHAKDVFWDARIPHTERSDTLFALADVLVADNTSLAWEFMALDRPVIWLNAPWYRRGVEMGMRFWEYADAGEQVESPGELPAAIKAARKDTRRKRRRDVIDRVYAYRDGSSTQRAVAAILEVFGKE